MRFHYDKMAHKIILNMTKWHVAIDYMCQMYYTVNGDNYDTFGN